MSERILIGGIGNIFLGDDAFGVEVLGRLAQLDWPPGVRLRDFGIRGMDLTYALLESYEHVILIDAAPRGGAPGTLYVIEPRLSAGDPPDPAGLMLDMHNMDPVRVMRLVNFLGGKIQGLTVVACEPARIDADEMESGLSPAVAAAIEPAVALVRRLVDERLAGQPSGRAACMSQSSR